MIDEGKGGERIRVMDSRSAAGGMGLAVLGAAAAAAAGGDAGAVLARAEETREALKMWFAIDTLEYLRRGGRIGGAKRGGKTETIKLASGDVLVMGGESRLRYHGIDRILPGTSTLLKDGGRLNLTLRRVTKPQSSPLA